ncbi:MAG: PAS domain S-box protein [Balneolales bacterium]
MKESDLQLLKSVCRDQEAYVKAKAIFDQLNEDKDKAVQSLNLLETAISNDYDSIIITELNVENPAILYVNEGFEKMTGFTSEEVIGKTPKILQGPKTDRKELDRLKDAIKQGKSYFGQAINYRKDGTEFINQWDIHPLVNKNGDITHWVSYQHDITERKSIEKSYSITEADYQKSREETACTVVDFLENGLIHHTNNAFRKLTGYQMEELTAFKIWELMPHNLSSVTNMSVETLWKNNIPVKAFTTLLKHKNGLPVQVEVHLKSLSFSNTKIVRATIINLSLRKKVFKTLQKRNSQYKLLMEQKSDFKYELSLDNLEKAYYTWLSDGFKSVTGFQPEEYLSTEA